MNINGCTLEFDERTNTVTIRSRFGTILMTVKLEAGMEGTMTRVNEREDCDNFWIALKPADSVVFHDGLFSKKRVLVKEFKFDLI